MYSGINQTVRRLTELTEQSSVKMGANIQATSEISGFPPMLDLNSIITGEVSVTDKQAAEIKK